MKKSILVVDNDNNTRISLAKALSADYITYTASNGHEALDILLGNKDIEIVLTDINMPEMDGFELLKRIRFTNKNITTIMITGHSDIFTENGATQKGAFAYFAKPIDLKILDKSIQSALESKSSNSLYP